jgi:ATP-dependent Lhr-like helicase
VLIHQLLVMALAAEGITATAAWDHLANVPDFQGISHAEFERLLAWLIEDHALRVASGRLVLGAKVERLFGRRNFMELYAVFSSPQTYTVQTTDGRPLGSLNQEFVDRLVEDISCFLLGGRPWAVLHVQHDDRRVIVTPAPRGREPTWGGFLPQFLSYELCQRILPLLTDDTPYSYLDDAATAVLAERRESLRPILRPGVGGIAAGKDEIYWWTFAGGRINGTLRYALETLDQDWKIVTDNFAVRVYGSGLSSAGFRAALAPLRDAGFWQDRELWRAVMDDLPNYRLSKFQPLMPDWVAREVVAGYLLDIEGARGWVARFMAGRVHAEEVEEVVQPDLM